MVLNETLGMLSANTTLGTNLSWFNDKLCSSGCIPLDKCTEAMKGSFNSAVSYYAKLNWIYIGLGILLFVAWQLRYTRFNRMITKKVVGPEVLEGFTVIYEPKPFNMGMKELHVIDRYGATFTKWFNIICDNFVSAGVVWTLIAAIYLSMGVVV